jgi:hypothetical protein
MLLTCDCIVVVFVSNGAGTTLAMAGYVRLLIGSQTQCVLAHTGIPALVLLR